MPPNKTKSTPKKTKSDNHAKIYDTKRFKTPAAGASDESNIDNLKKETIKKLENAKDDVQREEIISDALNEIPCKNSDNYSYWSAFKNQLFYLLSIIQFWKSKDENGEPKEDELPETPKERSKKVNAITEVYVDNDPNSKNNYIYDIRVRTEQDELPYSSLDQTDYFLKQAIGAIENRGNKDSTKKHWVNSKYQFPIEPFDAINEENKEENKVLIGGKKKTKRRKNRKHKRTRKGYK